MVLFGLNVASFVSTGVYKSIWAFMVSQYWKTLIFGGYVYLALLAVETKIPKIRDREVQYTISNKWTHILSMLVFVSTDQKQLLNGRV